MNKNKLNDIIKKLIEKYPKKDFWNTAKKELLEKKIKFPYLEIVGQEIFRQFGKSKALIIADELIKLDYVGSYVVAGKILQKRLSSSFEKSQKKACQYMVLGDEWYVCDIIGERVFGYGLLLDFDKQYRYLKSYINHPSLWIKRSVGVAAHYAAKNGIDKEKAKRLFDLVLLQAKDKNLHVKKGCGWAVETIAKFYPSIAIKYKKEIEKNASIAKWVKQKFIMGLSKSKI